MEINAPLSGKCIVITRAPGQGEDLRAGFALQGARVIELPCVEFRELLDSAELDAALRNLGTFDWLLFTSQNAVQFFARRARGLGIDPARLPQSHPRVAAIGPATAQAAASEGFSVAFVPPAGTGRTFAAGLIDSVRSVAGMEVKNPIVGFLSGLKGKKILVPRSDLALRDRSADWMELLREAGANITTVVAYRTCMPESLAGPQLDRIRNENVDCFVFASPSAFDNFSNSLGSAALHNLSNSSAFAALGPTTAAAIRAKGIKCVIESPEPTAKSLISAIVAHFQTADCAKTTPAIFSQGAKHA